MKHIKTTLAAVLAVVLTGCASTSQPDRTDYPTLTVLNPTPYVWDDKKSLALNVAKMAEPAGVGIGLEDSDNATDASTGQSSSGDRALGLGIMALSQGVFGLVSDSVMTDKAEQALKWRPALIDLVPVSDIGTNINPESFKKLRTIVGNKIIASMKAAYSDLQYVGSFTPTNPRSIWNSIFMFQSSACKEYMKFHSGDPESAPDYQPKLFYPDLIEKSQLPENKCSIDSKLSIAGTIERNNVQYYIVVNELMMGQNFIPALVKSYDGYILVPETFRVDTYDKFSQPRQLVRYATMFYMGNESPFVKPR